MIPMLTELVSSKKFTTSQLGIAAVILCAMYLPSEKAIAIAAIGFITASAVIAQGLADHGSVASEIKAEADKLPKT